MQNLIQSISSACSINFTHYYSVEGGDINDCYCVHSSDEKYFLKLNDALHFPYMFEKEAAGLDALRNNILLQVPNVLQQGTFQNKQWLLLEWIEKTPLQKNSMEGFGAALATLHKTPQSFFGWHNNNYIGSLLQINSQHQSWTGFYTQCRILPLVKILFDTAVFSKTDTDLATAFCRNMTNIFPEEPSARLHGDLWSGNYIIGPKGNAIVFDPAVYCGHREMDLGMTKLFGGFSDSFYTSYLDTYPLEKDWQQRIPLTQLYPRLVHAVLFGGHYLMNVKEILKKFS